MTYSVIVLTLKEMSNFIHALHVVSNPDIPWWDISDKTKRDTLREGQDLIEIQFFLQEAPHDALLQPHDDTTVTSSLFDVCATLQQWLDTDVSPCYRLHSVIPIDVGGAVVVVFTH